MMVAHEESRAAAAEAATKNVIRHIAILRLVSDLMLARRETLLRSLDVMWGRSVFGGRHRGDFGPSLPFTSQRFPLAFSITSMRCPGWYGSILFIFNCPAFTEPLQNNESCHRLPLTSP
jgi:hypothetical protein